jgi:hypothetical protein
LLPQLPSAPLAPSHLASCCLTLPFSRLLGRPEFSRLLQAAINRILDGLDFLLPFVARANLSSHLRGASKVGCKGRVSGWADGAVERRGQREREAC